MKYIPCTIIFCFSFLSSFILNSQAPLAGIQLGYGQSFGTSRGIQFISPFRDFFQNYYRADIVYAYPLDKTLTIITGLGYHIRESSNANFHHLHLPVSPEVVFGGKIEGIIGAGIDFNYLVAYILKSEYVYSGFDESKNRFHIGWQFHGGIGINLSSKTKIRLLYQNYLDITKAYKLNQNSPGGAPYTIDERWYDGMILLSVLGRLTYDPPKE